jgi:hypothetical protein
MHEHHSSKVHAIRHFDVGVLVLLVNGGRSFLGLGILGHRIAVHAVLALTVL